ncbi:homoprotocatechuate degradation operon regulator HpaR [Neptunicoccus sediminis]|uniref:homoprotocatechuate degradation operon regulator HpaR n=1 Tax=Neptunicoccus sediminis TaxID=1892596 RepID=UPI0008460A6D|nr:homoprotocatechuate degradation operon regulator HpaR [Neptunicoccus sediminis]
MNKSLPVLLSRARDTLLYYWRPKLSEIGFTEQQWRVMRVVAEQDRIDITSLAEATAMHMPSVTRILQVLEDGGMVQRWRDPDDSRRSWVRATRKSHDLMAQCVEASNQIYGEIEKRFSEEKMEKMLALLQEFSELRPRDR